MLYNTNLCGGIVEQYIYFIMAEKDSHRSMTCRNIAVELANGCSGVWNVTVSINPASEINSSLRL